MKVIFLDIDGVMATRDTFGRRVTVDGHGFCAFAPAPVQALNRVLAETGAEIVVSSSWRCQGPRWEALLLHFERQGVSRRPIDRTPDLSWAPGSVFRGVQRGAEIKDWLSNNVVESFVTIDDDTDMDPVRDQFVWVANGSRTGGMSEVHADRAIAILNGR